MRGKRSAGICSRPAPRLLRMKPHLRAERRLSIARKGTTVIATRYRRHWIGHLIRARHRFVTAILVVAATQIAMPVGAQEQRPPKSPRAVAEPDNNQATPEDEEAKLKRTVDRLIDQLLADRSAERAAAREELLKKAGPTEASGQAVLMAMPLPSESMPPPLRRQVAEIRKTIETRIARQLIEATKVTLEVTDAPLSELLAELEKQTGNRVIDYREQFGQEQAKSPVTLNLKEQPFWAAVDQLLDQTNLGLYGYAGEDALAIVKPDESEAVRFGRASYAGPFRFEVTEVIATRSLRTPDKQSLAAMLEVAWEPRLKPIAISHPLSSVVAKSESGTRLSLTRPEEEIDIEIQPGNQTTSLRLPFLLPTRETKVIASLAGQLEVLTPGRSAEFRFAELDQVNKPRPQAQGGVTVTLEKVRKSGAIWELHMSLKLDDAQDALASHRGWVFQNKTFLLPASKSENETPTPIDHAGFETTRQSSDEIGIAYLFDLPAEEYPDGMANLTWVYETPAAIVRFPVKYELKDIPLP